MARASTAAGHPPAGAALRTPAAPARAAPSPERPPPPQVRARLGRRVPPSAHSRSRGAGGVRVRAAATGEAPPPAGRGAAGLPGWCSPKTPAGARTGRGGSLPGRGGARSRAEGETEGWGDTESWGTEARGGHRDEGWETGRRGGGTEDGGTETRGALGGGRCTQRDGDRGRGTLRCGWGHRDARWETRRLWVTQGGGGVLGGERYTDWVGGQRLREGAPGGAGVGREAGGTGSGKARGTAARAGVGTMARRSNAKARAGWPGGAGPCARGSGPRKPPVHASFGGSSGPAPFGRRQRRRGGGAIFAQTARPRLCHAATTVEERPPPPGREQRPAFRAGAAAPGTEGLSPSCPPRALPRHLARMRRLQEGRRAEGAGGLGTGPSPPPGGGKESSRVAEI